MSTVHVSRSGWAAITLVGALPWLIVVWLLGRPPSPPLPTAAQASPAATASAKAAALPARDDYVLGAPGPWGRIRSTRILIEPPADFIPTYFSTPQPLRWTFPGFTPAQLDSLWDQARLSSEQRAALSGPAHCAVEPAGIVVAPPASLVLGLSPEARAIIYAVLARFPQNIPQREPFRSRVEMVDEWLDGEAIPPAVVALTRRLLYRRETNFLLSDHDLVLPHFNSSSDRVAYIKTLARKSALLAELVIPRASAAEIEPISRYWSHGRRTKDIGPILESLAQRPHGGTLDLVHLLPPFARNLLYTYPVSTGADSDNSRDCHWTSFNFFNPRPDERFLDVSHVLRVLAQDYYLASGSPMMGDLLLFIDEHGQGIHSCVYIADNIVFTKNGASFSIPWLLANLENVVAFYSLNGPVEVRRYRLR